MDNTPILQVENLCVYANFLRDTQRIVDEVSFCVGKGERLAIVGESGSGKSMIVNALIGNLADNCFAGGRALYCGEDLFDKNVLKSLMGQDIAFVPQGGAEALNPSLKIKTQMYEAFKKRGLKLDKNVKRALALKYMKNAGLYDEEVLEKYPFEISGGQAQRVVLAIALSMGPKLVIADEATRGIDEVAKDEFWQLTKEMFKNCAFVLVTHDMKLALDCDKIIVLKDGKVVEQGYSRDIVSNTKDVYTRDLLEVSGVQYD